MNALEIRAAASLAAVYVLRMLGLFMVMPVLALYAVDYPDYSALLVGLAIGGYGLTQALLQIPMGMWSDRFGRKPVIIAGLGVFAAGSLVAATADSMAMLVMGRFMQGAGAIAGAIMALAADVSREHQRPKVMAAIGIAIGFSFYLSLLLGPAIGQLGGLTAIFIVTAVLALLCIPLVSIAVPTPSGTAPSGDTLPNIADIGRMLRDPQLARLNISVLLLHMLITVFFVTIPGMLQQQGVGVEHHWAVYLPVLISAIVGMALLMRIASYSGIRVVILVSVLLLATAMLGMSSSIASIYWLGLCCIVFFTGFNYLEANFPALVSSLAPAGKKGSAMGLYASFQFFGAFAGGLFSGLLISLYSAQTVLIVMALICILWLMILKGVDASDLLKRYTIQFNIQHPALEQLQSRLIRLPGVVDVTLEPVKGVAYLKVDGQQFDIQQARIMVNNITTAQQVEE